MHNTPRQTLCTIIRDYGRDVADDPKRCKGLLLDLCGEYHREINILISAMNERVASDLLKPSSNIPHQILLPRLVRRLVDNLAMDELAAQWVVETWALALGVIAESALKPPAPPPSPAPAPPRVAPVPPPSPAPAPPRVAPVPPPSPAPAPPRVTPPPVTVPRQPPRQTTWLRWALGGGVVVVLVLALLVVLLALPNRGPVTLDEWRDEIAQRGTELTRDGDHYWRYVPSGIYTIGGWTDDTRDNNDEAADIELSPYWIARFPVTNQQYRQFIEAGGYDTRAYWTDNGWAWKEAYNEGKGRTQPYRWDDTGYTSKNQPVVGVTWYEAMAFAAWLNTELADSLPDGMQVRLPTEAEWEAACAYDASGQRHTYPWGEDEPTRDLADIDDGSNPDRAAVVGERPAGAAASGAQDMVGSVWEFTTNAYDTFPATSGEVVGDFDTSTYVPLRGGSW